MEPLLVKLRRRVEIAGVGLPMSNILSTGILGSCALGRQLYCSLSALDLPIESTHSLQRVRPIASSQERLKGWHQVTVKEHSGWSRSLLTLPLAAASLLAVAVSGGASRASCEPEVSPPANAPARILEEQVIKQHINELWRRLEERMHCLSAGIPEGKAAQSLGEPSVVVKQGQVEIAVEIPQNLDIDASVSQIRLWLRQSQMNTYNWSNERLGVSGGPTSISETSTSGPRGTARRIRKTSINQNETIEIEVIEPYDKKECAQLEFRGPATHETLQLVAGSLEEVVHPSSDRGQSLRHSGGLFESLSQKGSNFFKKDEMEDEVESFWGPILDLMHEIQRDLQQQQRRLESDGSLESWLKGDDGTDFIPFKGSQELQSPNHGGSTDLAHKQDPAVRSSKQKLERLGCQVFFPDSQTKGSLDRESNKSTNEKMDHSVVDWGQLAGYYEQKQTIEDSLLLPLMRPEVYDEIARGTREQFQSNRPRAVLFVGPPGTGKTTSAKVIASQASVPLVYIPLEALVSKWYGESEKSLAGALQAADGFPEGCIIFLDELDSLATTRGGEMHEATRRILGVLLRHIDGFDSKKRSIVVGATNRPQDLDPALRSRFSTIVPFELPGEEYRVAILKKYAHHLEDSEIQALAASTPGMAGRDLKDCCEQAERIWAAAIIRGEVSSGGLPPLNVYLKAARARMKEMADSDSVVD